MSDDEIKFRVRVKPNAAQPICKIVSATPSGREKDNEARRDLVASEELHRRRFGSLKAEFEQVMRERDEARKEWEEALEGWNTALDERNKAREIARLAFYIIRGVDPKFVKLAYEKSVHDWCVRNDIHCCRDGNCGARLCIWCGEVVDEVMAEITKEEEAE